MGPHFPKEYRDPGPHFLGSMVTRDPDFVGSPFSHDTGSDFVTPAVLLGNWLFKIMPVSCQRNYAVRTYGPHAARGYRVKLQL